MAHEVTNDVTDQLWLAPMTLQAQAMIKAEEIEVVADRGYYDSQNVKQCVDAGITPYVSQPPTSKNGPLGRFAKEAFTWEDESLLEEMRNRVQANPQRMKQRREIVEHPFGTLKRGMNQGYFLCRGLTKVRGEMSLSILSYNLKRVFNILGTEAMIAGLIVKKTVKE